MNHLHKQDTGFTLVEVLVVIVIMSILMSLVTLNISGMDQRKAMQQRELLILDLKKINREANDQARVYALQTEAANDVHPFQYRIVEYVQPQQPPLGTAPTSAVIQAGEQTWRVQKQFPLRELPEQMSFQVESQEQNYSYTMNQDLVGERAPKLIWFGNGEAKPAQIQIYYAQQAVGAPINIDYLGKVDAES